MDCLFCKIAAGEIKSDKVYEDAEVLAFRDIAPQAPVHVVVIPKRHLNDCAEISGDNSSVTARIFEVIAELSREMGLENGFRVVCNCGADGGQTVPHLHFHLLAGRSFAWPPG